MYLTSGLGPFGLRHGQTRQPFVALNVAWYNKAGEWIGMGSLSVADLDSIALGLEHGELFIIIPEKVFMNCDGDIETPGADFLADAAMLVIAPRQVFEVDHFDLMLDGKAGRPIKDRLTGDELMATYLSEDQVLDLLQA